MTNKTKANLIAVACIVVLCLLLPYVAWGATIPLPEVGTEFKVFQPSMPLLPPAPDEAVDVTFDFGGFGLEHDGLTWTASWNNEVADGRQHANTQGTLSFLDDMGQPIEEAALSRDLSPARGLLFDSMVGDFTILPAGTVYGFRFVAPALDTPSTTQANPSMRFGVSSGMVRVVPEPDTIALVLLAWLVTVVYCVCRR